MPKICNVCQKEQSDDNRFCNQCGASFEEALLECKKCGKENAKDDLFCSDCGARLKKKSKEERQSAYPKIRNIIFSWVAVAVFALLFGFSFLSIMKVDLSTVTSALNGGSISSSTYLPDAEFTVSAIDILDAVIKGPKSMEEVTEEFSKYLMSKLPPGYEGWDEIRAMNFTFKHLEKFGVMKVMYTQEALQLAPVSIKTELYTLLITGLLFMLGSFAGLIIALITAIEATFISEQTKRGKFSFKINYILLAALSGVLFFIIPFATSATGGIVTGGLIVSLIGFAGFAIAELVLSLIDNRKTEKQNDTKKEDASADNKFTRRKKSKLGFICTALSFIFVMTSMFVFSGNTFVSKTESRSMLGSAYTQKYKTEANANYAMIDLYILMNNEELAFKFGKLDAVIKSHDQGNKSLENYVIQMSFFFEDTDAYAKPMYIVGILYLILYMAAAVVMSALIALLIKNLAPKQDGKSLKLIRGLMIAALSLFVALLAMDIVTVASVNSIFDQLGSDSLRAGITASPILAVIFLTGTLVLNFITKANGGFTKEPKKLVKAKKIAAPVVAEEVNETAEPTDI